MLTCSLYLNSVYETCNDLSRELPREIVATSADNKSTPRDTLIEDETPTPRENPIKSERTPAKPITPPQNFEEVETVQIFSRENQLQSEEEELTPRNEESEQALPNNEASRSSQPTLQQLPNTNNNSNAVIDENESENLNPVDTSQSNLSQASSMSHYAQVCDVFFLILLSFLII